MMACISFARWRAFWAWSYGMPGSAAVIKDVGVVRVEPDTEVKDSFPRSSDALAERIVLYTVLGSAFDGCCPLWRGHFLDDGLDGRCFVWAFRLQ